jgi:hypothetical protein
MPSSLKYWGADELELADVRDQLKSRASVKGAACTGLQPAFLNTKFPGRWNQENPQRSGLRKRILRLMLGTALVVHIRKARANEEDDVMISVACGTPPDGEHSAPAAVVSDTGPLPAPRPLSQRVTDVEDCINAFVTNVEDGINALVTDVEDGINSMVTDVEDGVHALVTGVEDAGSNAVVCVEPHAGNSSPAAPLFSAFCRILTTARAKPTPPPKQLDALSNVYGEATVQPLLTAETSTLSNPLLTADVPTAPSASRSVDSAQAQLKFEQALQNSMLERELRLMREMADLYKSQRDEAKSQRDLALDEALDALTAKMLISSQPTVNQ